MILEIKTLLDYRERETTLSFFRTSDGAEVDVILEQQGRIWAIEIKSNSAPRISDVRGLKSFKDDHKCDRAICVCQTPRSYLNDGMEFMPWREFLSQL
jgi:predicted AAA+ superfamily ATPase